MLRRLIPAASLLVAACGGAAPPAPAVPSAREEPTSGLVAAGAPEDLGFVTISASDVGQGDAILIDFGYRQLQDAGSLCRVEWLIDGGPSGRQAMDIMSSVDCELDALVLSHPHSDHYVGATPILEHRFQGIPVVSAVMGSGETRGPPRDDESPSTWTAFVTAMNEAGLELGQLTEGQVLEPAPERRVTVLWAGGQFEDTSQGSDINNDSVVLMLEYAGRRVLLTGDTESEAQTQMLERYCTEQELASEGPCAGLHADVLKVPHHGSDHVSRRFFAAVHPSVALISAGHRNRQYHHPRAEIVEFLLDMGVEVRSTSADGDEDASVRIDANGEMTTEGPEEIFAWRQGDAGWEEATLPTHR